MSHPSDRWDRGYHFLESKTKQNDIGVFGCEYDCIRTRYCCMQCMQKQTGVCFFVLRVWTAAPPLPAIHMLSSWSRFLGRLHTMPSLAAYRCSFHLPTQNLMTLVLLKQLQRNCLHYCMLCPIARRLFLWVFLSPRFSLSESLRTAGGIRRQRQHQPYHPVRPHTVPWTRQTLPVVQIVCCFRSSIVPDPSHQWYRLRELE